MKKAINLMTVFIAACLLTVPANAALIDRGTGMIYDTDLGITWLQDANYAQTSGYDADGRMTWEQAKTWTSNLAYGGYSGWQLPKTSPITGTIYNTTYSSNGSTDIGDNISAPGSAYPGSTGSAMAYMYYNNLGNLGYRDIYGNPEQPGWGLQNTGPFINLNPSPYWSLSPIGPLAFGFTFDQGVQADYVPIGNERKELYAWAVRNGDIGPSASVGNPYNTTMVLGRSITFDYWWVMGQEPEGFNLDILFLSGGEWKSLFGWKFNLHGSSTEWETASFMVPEELRGLDIQLRFQVFDLGVDTDPTVYLRNIASSTAPVPEPSTMLLLASGLVGLAGLRKRFKKG